MPNLTFEKEFADKNRYEHILSASDTSLFESGVRVRTSIDESKPDRGYVTKYRTGTRKRAYGFHHAREEMLRPVSTAEIVGRINGISIDYPLLGNIIISIRSEKGKFRAEYVAANIMAMGESREEAVNSLMEELAGLIFRLDRTPPHELSEAEENLWAHLSQLVNWEDFDMENPQPQYVTGEIIDKSADYVTILWQDGPGGKINEESKFPVNSNLPPDLIYSDIGTIFSTEIIEEAEGFMQWGTEFGLIEKNTSHGQVMKDYRSILRSQMEQWLKHRK